MVEQISPTLPPNHAVTSKQAALILNYISTSTPRSALTPTVPALPFKANGDSSPGNIATPDVFHHPPPDQGLPGYVAVTSDVMLFTTPADALAQYGAYYRLPVDEAYLSYTATQTLEGQILYQVAPDRWLRSQDARLLQPSTFAGLLFDTPPNVPFGWALQKLQSTDEIGQPRRVYERYQPFQLAASLLPGAAEDVLPLGLDEFLPRAGVALVETVPSPPAAAKDCRRIEINLNEQTLLAFENCHLRFATLIASGCETTQTPTGVYHILQLVQHKDLRSLPGMSPSYLMEDVPYVIYFQHSFAIHAAYWHDSFEQACSHGCINLSPADAAWLYAWVRLGDPVVINP